MELKKGGFATLVQCGPLTFGLIVLLTSTHSVKHAIHQVSLRENNFPHFLHIVFFIKDWCTFIASASRDSGDNLCERYW